MNKKNGQLWFGGIFSFCLFLALASCTSYVPIASSDAAMANSNVKFTVLGSVSMRIDQVAFGEQLGIKALLLKEAKKTYPNANAVVDITYTGLNNSVTGLVYIAEGVVILFE